VLLVIGGLLGAFVAYEAVTSVVAYTDDAYVRSDLVAVAPQVTGQIIAVHVHDNQDVKAGDPLVTIDPTPFQLAVAERLAQIAEAKAQIAADQDRIAVARDALAEAEAARALAQETQARTASLVRTQDVSQQTLDQAEERLRVAQSRVQSATTDIAKAQTGLAMHQAAQCRAEAALGTAQWQLARTRVVAPVDGTVNNLTVRVGDQARADDPLIGVVDAHAWRIIANYKQDYLRHLREGATAWVWLDSQPWHFHRGRIRSVARGISRSEDEAKLLPYVAPTTDWIRLQRRFPVTIDLVDGDGLTLYMGADARTVIFP
jgi:multidrug efflux system membrane fusion protein